MTQGPRYHVKPRRHRQGRTDYRTRLALLKSKQIRIVVRKSIKNTRVQFINYFPSGDQILVSTVSDELTKKYNWKYSTASTPAAYLTGLLAGVKAKEKGVTEGILDIGRYTPTPGSKLFAVVKGVLDAGITIPHDKEMLPKQDRLLWKHLSAEIANQVTEMKNKIVGAKA